VHSIKADLGNAAECERLANEAIEWSPTGGIDILVSNAGAGKRKEWFDVSSFETNGNGRLQLKNGMRYSLLILDLLLFFQRVCFILNDVDVALYPFMEKQVVELD
jgi:NAD(P)-dependent dehydrogenase (short-subunit alcohol dehydrogenase family)